MGALLFSFGCSEASPYVGPSIEGLDDASVDADIGLDADTGVDAATVADALDAPEGLPEVERCELDGTEFLSEEEFVVQIRNPECSTSICLHYNLTTFCTTRCTQDNDCRDLAEGLCELEIFVGDPEMFGWYCVPSFASRAEE